MVFNSISFIILFVSCFILYWACKSNKRKYILLIASFLFYINATPNLIWALLLATVVIYFSAIHGEKNGNVIFGVGFLIALLILIFYKYSAFFTGDSLIMPVGISFYTLQGIGYLVDVKNGKYKSEKDFFTFLLYMSFFPQLMSGPIGRGDSLLPQYNNLDKITFSYDRAMQGAQMFLWGCFKKMAIADRLAYHVGIAFDTPQTVTGMSLIVASILYSVQIYCDFSGYSDMAVGVARLLGIDLMVNFRTPYFSTSIKEFWSRWHISLSTWLKNYVYIPLGGSRKGKIRLYINLVITFLVSGIWHGATLNYIVWGGIHAVYQVSSRLFTKNIKNNSLIINILKSIFCFALVTFAWIFFRASDLTMAINIITKMFTDLNLSVQGVKDSIVLLKFDTISLITTVLLIGFAFVLDLFIGTKDAGEYLNSRNKIVKVSLCYIFILGSLFLSYGAAASIYFAF